jgi:hypothetical protein
MNSLKNHVRNESSHEALELAGYRCPSCHRLAWHDDLPNGKISCPFCSTGLPTYMTKIVPETMVPSYEAIELLGREIAEQQNGTSPFIIEFFMVQGPGFCCMAYRNHDGKWKRAFDHYELPGAVRILE